MAEYSFTPQFANLSGIQPLPAIDVTRGGALPFQPLQAIEVPSARPELVGAGIASAIERIGSGVLSGITAKYEEKKEAEREQLEHERQLELYGAKKRSENEEFFQRQLAIFDAENFGRIDYPEKRAALINAYSGIRDRLPEIQPKEKSETTPSQPLPVPVEVDLPTQGTSEVPADAGQPLAAEFVSGPAGFGFGASVSDEKQKMALEGLGAPTTAAKQLEEIPIPQPAITGVPQQPEDPAAPRNVPGEVKSKSLASQIAAEINKTSTISKVDVELNQSTGGYGFVQRDIETAKQEAQAKAESKIIEQEKLDIAKAKEAREKAESEQKMAIDAQKKKDAPSILWKAAEDNGLLLKEINLILNTIEEDESVLGPGGYAMSLVAMTKSREVRDSLDTIISKMTLGSLQNLREASPTGGALGNVSDKDISILRDAAGKINLNSGRPETVKAKLNDFKRKFEIIQKKLVGDPNWDVEQYPIPYTDWGIDKKPQKFTKINDSKSNATNALIKEKDELLQKMTSGSEEYKASEQYKKDRDRVKEILQQIQ